MEPADPQLRLLAHLADRVLLGGGVGLLTLGVAHATGRPGPTVLALLGTLLAVALASAAVTGRWGTTPGHRLLGLRVLGTDGRPVGVRRALVRSVVLGLAELPTLGLGLAILARTALTDPSGWRRGLHDRIAGTVVVARAAPAHMVETPAPTAPSTPVNLTTLRLLPDPEPFRGTLPAPAPHAAAHGTWRLVEDGAEVPVGRGARLGTLRIRVAPAGALVVIDDGASDAVVVRRGHARAVPPRRATTLLAGDVVQIQGRAVRVDRRV